MNLPPCLSIKQPWAWLITHAGKDVENRTWRAAYRGPFLIHAGSRPDADAYAALETLRFGRPLPGEDGHGGIVGIAEMVDCVTESDSPWFSGPVGFVLANARPLPFVPMRGRLSFFAVPPADVAAVQAALRGVSTGMAARR